MKWLIVEDALRDRKGHWLEYVSTFVRGLTALGDEVQVLCDRKAEGFVIEQTGALPVLPESIWHRMGDGAGAAKRYLRVPWHALATFVVMRKFFRSFYHRGHREHGGVEEQFSQGTAASPTESAGLRPDFRSGAPKSDSLTSKLADSSVSESPIRSANGPASSPATSYPLPATAPEALALDARPSPLDSGEAPDWIFVPTVLVHHLLGWWLLIKSGSVPKGARVLLFFPNLPINLDDARRPFWSAGPTTKLMAWLFGHLRWEVETGRLVLGVETHAMRRALESLIGMRVVYLPHPVQAAKPPRTDIEGLRTEDGDQRSEALDSGLSTLDSKTPATSNSLPATAAKPLIFGCYGAARWEKGSDIFQEAIKLILSNEVASKKCRVASLEDEPQLVTRDPLPVTAAERPFRFCIQWVEDFREDSGNLVSINPWLREHPQVEVIGRYFEGNEYEQRLAQTDVMVLPYRKPYQLRVSRVVIEAMLNGMPVIAARGTTLFEQAEEYGIVVGCEEGNAEGLAESMLEVAQNFQMLQTSAELKVHVAAQNFSVACFRKIVMKSSYERK